jgi:hypothetical protein
MCAKWNDRFNPTVVVQQLQQKKVFDQSGAFSGFDISSSDLLPVLVSSLDFNPEIPDSERSRIVSKAVFSEAKAGTLDLKKIVGNVSHEENQYLRKPKRRFVLASTLSFRLFAELRNKVIAGAKITFARFLPRSFDQSPTADLRKHLGVPETPTDYISVRVSVDAREEREAVTNALDTLDLLRGLWNLRLNPDRFMSFNRSTRRPVNQVTFGPFHTLHLPDGKLATTDIIWYEPDYVENAHDVEANWEEVDKFELWALQKLAKHL